MKKIIDNLISICIFISIITLPFVYYSIYNTLSNSENPNYKWILTTIFIICHIIAGKHFYDIYVDKYGEKYHDKPKENNKKN